MKKELDDFGNLLLALFMTIYLQTFFALVWFMIGKQELLYHTLIAKLFSPFHLIAGITVLTLTVAMNDIIPVTRNLIIAIHQKWRCRVHGKV